MNGHPRVDEWIRAALTYSGLPMSRRAETAEEWRTHLDQLIDDKQGAGMSPEQAVRAAVSAFGRPEAVRRQLRREQTNLDRRAAIAEVRRLAWLFAVLPALFVVLAVIAVDPHSIGGGVLAALPGFACISLAMAGATYFAVLVQLRVMRRRPQAEFSFPRRLALWSTVVLSGLLGGIGMLLLFSVAATYPLHMYQPWFAQIGPGQFSRFLGYALSERMEVNLLVTLGSVAVFALSLTLYERSRCVDLPGEPTAGDSGSQPIIAT